MQTPRLLCIAAALAICAPAAAQTRTLPSASSAAASIPDAAVSLPNACPGEDVGALEAGRAQIELTRRERGSCQPPEPQTLRLQLARVDTRLAELERQRAELGLAAPIALVATGGSIVIASVLGLAVASFQMADYMDHGEPIPARLLHQRLGFGIAALAGLGLATGGTVWSIKRIRARRALMPEVRALTRERRALDPVLVTPVVGPSSLGLVIGTKF